MRIDKGHGMEECAADSREPRDLRRVLRYSLPDKDFGLRYRSESSTAYGYVRLTRIPLSGLAKIII